MGEISMHDCWHVTWLIGNQGTFEAKSSSLCSSCFFFRALTWTGRRDGSGGIFLVMAWKWVRYRKPQVWMVYHQSVDGLSSNLKWWNWVRLFRFFPGFPMIIGSQSCFDRPAGLTLLQLLCKLRGSQFLQSDRITCGWAWPCYIWTFATLKTAQSRMSGSTIVTIPNL